MIKEAFKHFKTVCRHKWYVWQECKACGIAWQGLKHDLSKFSAVEFLPSARYFQGNRSPIEAEKEALGYSAAWLHHKGCNPHHWEYWTDFKDETGEIIANKIPYKYVVEMVCDWIGAGKAYNSGHWTQDMPMKHYQKMLPGRYFHPETQKLIEEFMECIRDDGLEAFHKRAKSVYTKADYEGKYLP